MAISVNPNQVEKAEAEAAVNQALNAFNKAEDKDSARSLLIALKTAWDSLSALGDIPETYKNIVNTASAAFESKFGAESDPTASINIFKDANDGGVVTEKEYDLALKTINGLDVPDEERKGLIDKLNEKRAQTLVMSIGSGADARDIMFQLAGMGLADTRYYGDAEGLLDGGPLPDYSKLASSASSGTEASAATGNGHGGVGGTTSSVNMMRIDKTINDARKGGFTQREHDAIYAGINSDSTLTPAEKDAALRKLGYTPITPAGSPLAGMSEAQMRTLGIIPPTTSPAEPTMPQGDITLEHATAAAKSILSDDFTDKDVKDVAKLTGQQVDTLVAAGDTQIQELNQTAQRIGESGAGVATESFEYNGAAISVNSDTDMNKGATGVIKSYENTHGVSEIVGGGSAATDAIADKTLGRTLRLADLLNANAGKSAKELNEIANNAGLGSFKTGDWDALHQLQLANETAAAAASPQQALANQVQAAIDAPQGPSTVSSPPISGGPASPPPAYDGSQTYVGSDYATNVELSKNHRWDGASEKWLPI